ncbi:MAG: hypothetical protein BGN92_04995 [Sphingobacteriales bacterium 41-5]|nr:MAG: hypothetical protein BGN92_04995 [Sphingobacteriales bacterium 41-5]
MKYILSTAFILLLSIQSLTAQDSTKRKKVKILPVPTFGYSPETRTYIGAVTLFTFNLYDTATRTSNAKFEVSYTWNKQLIVETGWNYFFKDEKYFTRGLLHYSKYPDQYFGIGANTPESNKIIYNSNRFMAEGHLLKKIRKDIFTGPGLKYVNYSNVENTDSVKSYPELVDGATFGLGYSLLKDTRNNLLTPENGMYLNLNTTYNFSKKNYVELLTDFRYYKTWKEKYTLATRLVNDLNFGQIPFYDYAYLGGDKFVRGFFYGRYRDNYLSTLQTEFRTPVIWRFGLAAFGGISNLYSSENKFSTETTKFNYGAGLRFMIDRKDRTNLRIDYARGSDKNSGFYVAFGESF